ncbi:MAG: hypothetical protein AABP62_22310 [Planctomycetota bacterium]
MSSSVRPVNRRLRVFAFDPSLALDIETAPIQEIELKIPWEIDPQTGGSSVLPGPCGEYLEVIDHDPASKVVYAPINLNDGLILAQSGLSPSEGNPQFHQQMVFAVAMNTIANFEEALGRVALWAPRVIRAEDGRFIRQEFVRKLRIYPHALRDANAYYSPAKKSLLFGYFPAKATQEGPVAGSMVFTCLSQDIIAHETTHALLDGLHPRFGERTNRDVLALHEAFADIVGMLQRFSHPEVLRHQIGKTKGDLGQQNLLGQLAQQFGRAIGRGSALRDALGRTDAQGHWHPRVPDPDELARTTKPHDRGAILVAAVFDAFLLVYKSRIADLLRIATQGTGVLPPGEVHPDLVNRMAEEAASCAKHVLHMCIRALDYCPPVDITFGDYLRAIVTADADLYPDDEPRFRVAMIQAFRKRGIYPRGVRTLSEESLLWPTGAETLAEADATLTTPEQSRHSDKMHSDVRALVQQGTNISLDWTLEEDRQQSYEKMQANAKKFHTWLTVGPGRDWIPALGLTLNPEAPASVARSGTSGIPAIEVHSVRTALRRGARNSIVPELVVEIAQRRFGWFDRNEQLRQDQAQTPGSITTSDFRFRRGCTLLINPRSFDVRRVIRTPGTVESDDLLEQLRRFLTGEDPNPEHAFAGIPLDENDDETFARLHRLA